MQFFQHSPLSSLLKATALFAISSACILESGTVGAQVVFDDGKTHVIDNTDFESLRIEVRNGTTLKVEDGAVIGAELGPAFELAIHVFDKSKLIVRGGTFGGIGNASGGIAALGQASVIIEDGQFGTDGNFRSGLLVMLDESTVRISGGTFNSANGSGGRIELYDNAEARVSGGVHGGQKHLAGSSTLKITGGSFGVDNPGLPFPLVFRGAIFAGESSRVRISGGSFGASGFLFLSGAVWALGASDVRISGGTFNGAPFTGNGQVRANSPDTRVTISGGQHSSQIDVSAGLVKIEGCVFNLPFGPVTTTQNALEGILASGEVVNTVITRTDDPVAIIDLVQESCD